MAKKTKPVNPNLQIFHDMLDNAFKPDKTGKLVCGDMIVEFAIDGDEWKFSIDGGEKWHDGKFPSGANLIKHLINNSKAEPSIET